MISTYLMILLVHRGDSIVVVFTLFRLLLNHLIHLTQFPSKVANNFLFAMIRNQVKLFAFREVHIVLIDLFRPGLIFSNLIEAHLLYLILYHLSSFLKLIERVFNFFTAELG